MNPDPYCTDKTGGRGSDLYFSCLFLPPPKRAALTALHAFQQEVQDVGRECHDRGVAQVKLHWWREEIARAYRGQARHPVTRALTPGVESHGHAQDNFLAIIDVMETTLARVRYHRFEEVLEFCAGVASRRELLAADVLGGHDPATRRFAHALGLAFQLTDIIRSLGEDIRRDHLYLPQEDLDRFGVRIEELRQGHSSENFYALMAFETERAHAYFAQARAQLPDSDRPNLAPRLILAELQIAALAEIRADGFQVLRHRLRLTPRRKLWISLKTRFREWRASARHD
jgi:phytoene synthase